jgi:uncharacterized membrane protein
VNRSAWRLVLILSLIVAGCDSPKKTTETLRVQIAEFKTSPSDEQQAEIEANFVKLDEQIANLQARGKTTEANELLATEANLKAEFRAARMVKTIDDAKAAIQSIGEAFQEAGKSIERAIEDAKNTDEKEKSDQ